MRMKSVEAWNNWRHDHLDVEPNLSGADLRGGKFHGADLRRANLVGSA